MKKRILLIDESLTVQKVVALTLDKGNYQVFYGRNRQEVIKTLVDNDFDLILLSETVAGLSWQSFPKEMESWLGSRVVPPPVVLISGQELKEAKHFVAVLKKPFSPQALKDLVERVLEHSPKSEERLTSSNAMSTQLDELQEAFNKTFSDEDELLRQTFEPGPQEEKEEFEEPAPLGRPSRGARGVETEKPTPMSASDLWEFDSEKGQAAGRTPGKSKENTEDLWGTQSPSGAIKMEEPSMTESRSSVLGLEDSLAYKSSLENEVKATIQSQDLEKLVEKALSELMPPIVEKLVQERLDRLLKDHEESLAS